MGAGLAQPDEVTWDPLPVGSPSAGRAKNILGGSQSHGPWRSKHQLQKLPLWTWNDTSLIRQEPELARKVEKF